MMREREYSITLADENEVDEFYKIHQLVVCCEDVSPSTPIEELGQIVGQMTNETEINDTSASGNVIYVGIYDGAKMKSKLQAHCKKHGLKFKRI